MMVSTPNRRRARRGGKPHVSKHKLIITMAAVQQLLATYGSSSAAPGQVAYTTPGTYSWVCPAGVTSVCVVCVGSGQNSIGDGSNFGAGGNGGALSWGNNIPVVPGNTYTVVVSGASGTPSSFINTSTLYAGNYNSVGGTYRGSGGFGGFGGVDTSNGYGTGGGGAGGYSGNGGYGGSSINGAGDGRGSSGAGGAGGGGTVATISSVAGGGGGVGILGQGANGAAGVLDANGSGPGFGGSSGGNGTGQPANSGGTYGGGAGAGVSGATTVQGGKGAVRIIWGAGRAFPSTNTGNV